MARILKQLHPEASVTLYINRDNQGEGDYYWVEKRDGGRNAIPDGTPVGQRMAFVSLAKIEAREWLRNENDHACSGDCSDWEPDSN